MPFAPWPYIDMHEGFMAIGANATAARQRGRVTIDLPKPDARHPKVCCHAAQMIGLTGAADTAVVGVGATARNDGHRTMKMRRHPIEQDCNAVTDTIVASNFCLRHFVGKRENASDQEQQNCCLANPV
jgi:hypothetical protein